MSELVPQAVHDLLAFYKENCPEVRFGDLDLRTLERTVASIDEAAQRVIEAEEAVAQARVQFREVEAGLFGKVNRTLSFLKIFVDEDVEQQAKLETIANGLPGARRKAKAAAGTGTGEPKQRRRRKSKDGEEVEASDKPENAVEAALEKAGIFDEEEPSETESLDDDVAEDSAPLAAAPAKKGSKK